MKLSSPLSLFAAGALVFSASMPAFAEDAPPAEPVAVESTADSGAPEAETTESGAADTAAAEAADTEASPAEEAQSAADEAPEATARGGSRSATTINIVGITDLHGHIAEVLDKSNNVVEPGAVRLACEVEKVRAANPNTLFVSNGDNVGGSAYVSSILDDDPTIDVLNAMGLDVTSAGNHEFDQGISDLETDLIPSFNAPILSANVTGNAALTAEGSGDGTFITEVDGVKIGFIGVVTEELPSLVSKSAIEGLTIAGAVGTANERATELKSSGKADVVVVLAHADAAINGGQFNKDVDAVVGGHTHVPFAQVVTSTGGTTIAVVQPDHYGLLLGNITLTIEKNASGVTVTDRSASNTDLVSSDCTTDPYGVGPIVDKALADSQEKGKEVQATLGSDFLRGTNDGVKTGENRSTESTASNLIADSFGQWLATDIQPAGDHYIGLMNPGGVRADYAAGDLTVGQAFTVQPFGNEMAYAPYTGAQIKRLLAQQFQPTTTRSALMLGLSSNVSVTIDQSAASEMEAYYAELSSIADDEAKKARAAELGPAIDAARQRVISRVVIDGEEITDSDTIVAASNSFLLAGGDNFEVLGEVAMINTGILDREVTGNYLRALSDAGTPATASFIKRQTGFSGTFDPDSGVAMAYLTGLDFTALSEQGVRDAADRVAVRVAMADGSIATIVETDVDPTVVAGMPETGTAMMTFSLPEGVQIVECDEGGATTCSLVTFHVINADGSEYQLHSTMLLPAKAPADVEEPQGPATPAEEPAKPGKTGQLAKTGSDSWTVLAAALLVATAGGAVTLRRRRA